MDLGRVFQKLDTCHKAKRHPAAENPAFRRDHCNLHTKRADLGAYLGIALAILTYGGIAWGMGWLS